MKKMKGFIDYLIWGFVDACRGLYITGACHPERSEGSCRLVKSLGEWKMENAGNERNKPWFPN